MAVYGKFRRRRTFRRRRRTGRVFSKDGKLYQRKWLPYAVGSQVDSYGQSWASASPGQRLNRMNDKFYGMGDYKTALKYGSRMAGAAVGGIATRSIAGAAKGWQAGAGFSRLAGWGDYGPADGNQLISGSADVPISVNQADGDLTGDIYINHREFVADIVNTTADTFENRTFEINPGLSSSFPWLSQIAKNFTMYEFMGLIFEYKPTSGETGQANNSLGSIIMVTDYDPDAPAFTNVTEMQNYDYANSFKPSLDGVHGVETKPSQQAVRMNYIRTGATSRDKIFTDIGLFQIATDGIPETGAKVGELWVTYRVKVSRAKIASA